MAGVRNRSYNNHSTPFAKESFSQVEFQKLKKRRGDGPDMELRLLVRGRNAGAIIGKSGSNIKRIKQEYGVVLFLSDNHSPERILSVIGYFGSICEAVLDLIPLIDNNPPSDATDDVDVRILMHSSLTGYVIGRKGHGIRELRSRCNTRVKVYSDCCPRSTDRVVQINGGPVDIVNCIVTIVDMVIMYPPVGLILPYNPSNFVEIRALDYGGFTSYEVTVPFQGETVMHGSDAPQNSASKEAAGSAAPLIPASNAASSPDERGWTPSHCHPEAETHSSALDSRSHFHPEYHDKNSRNLDYSNPWEPVGGGAVQSPWSQVSAGQGQGQSWSTQRQPIVGSQGWGQGSADQGQSFSGQGQMGQNREYNEGTYCMPMAHGSQGHYGEQMQGHLGQTSAPGSQDNHRLSRARPLDQCPGLGFHPVDTRTVQVSIPKALQTVVMGRRGAAIRDIRLESKAKILIEVPPAAATERYLTLTGTPEQLQKAQYLLQRRYLDGKKCFTNDPEGFMNRGLKKRRLPDAPWMTEEIMKMKLMRRKLERVWRTAKTEETKKAFKDYSLEMNKAIRKVKEEYYKIHGGAPENKRKPKLDAEGNEIAVEKSKVSTEADSSQGDPDASDECRSSDEEFVGEQDQLIKTETDKEVDNEADKETDGTV